MSKSKSYDDWVKLIGDHPEVFEVVTPGDAEDVDAVICRLITDPLLMPDNLTGTCSKCFRMIQFRPHAPSRPPKICDECILPEVRKSMAKGDFQAKITPKTAHDLMEYWVKKSMN